MGDSMPFRGSAPRTRVSITLAVPSGWFYKESHLLIAPDGDVNVVASSEPLDPSMDSKAYAQAQGVLLETEFPGFWQYGGLQALHVDGSSGAAWLREFGWTPADGEPVRQLQIYAVRTGRGMTATASTLACTYPRHRDSMIRVLRSLVIDAQAADAMASMQGPLDAGPEVCPPDA